MTKVIPFDVFVTPMKRYGNELITITRASAFNFNSGFYSKNEIYDYTHVRLGYNEKEKIVGFNFVKVKQGTNKPIGSYLIKQHRSGNSGCVTVRAFFTRYNLNPAELKGEYLPHVQDDPRQGKFYYIKLDERLNAKQ